MLEREQIWRDITPANAPIDNINYNQLAQLSLTGGSIRNIMLNACFNAAADNNSLNMQYFLISAQHEYEKQDMALSLHEVQGWV